MSTGGGAQPAEFADELHRGASALGLVLGLAQERQLMAYLQLIERWGRVYNLTAVRDADGILKQHLLDSLAMLPALRRTTGGLPTRVLDVGSGAGLPGLALAIAAPELTVTCVDAVAKKAGFIRQVIAELGLPNASAMHARIETLDATTPWPLITSRAFASLSDFVGLTKNLLTPAGAWVAMKGKPPADEITALPESIEVFHVEPIQVPGLDAERCLVWMRQHALAF